MKRQARAGRAPGLARVLKSPRTRGLLLVSPPVLVIALFVGVSIVCCVLYTLGYGGGVNSTVSTIGMHQHLGFPTLGAFGNVLTDPEFLASLRATVGVTLVTTAVVLILAWALALWLRASNTWVSRVLTALSVVPMFIPGVIGAYAIKQFYVPNGFSRTVLDHLGWHSSPTFTYTLTGVVLGSVWASLPFAVLMITSGLSSVPEPLIEAARDVGAGPFSRLWHVMLPMTLVPTVIAATFTAINVMGSFTLPYIVGPTAPNLLGPLMNSTYGTFNEPQQAEVMAVCLFILALIAGVPYVWANFVAARRSAR